MRVRGQVKHVDLSDGRLRSLNRHQQNHVRRLLLAGTRRWRRRTLVTASGAELPSQRPRLVTGAPRLSELSVRSFAAGVQFRQCWALQIASRRTPVSPLNVDSREKDGRSDVRARPPVGRRIPNRLILPPPLVPHQPRKRPTLWAPASPQGPGPFVTPPFLGLHSGFRMRPSTAPGPSSRTSPPTPVRDRQKRPFSSPFFSGTAPGVRHGPVAH